MTQVSNTFPFKSYIPFYTNGLQISNDVSAPNTTFLISTGSVLDSSGTFQLVLINDLPVFNTLTGVNGLDTGTVSASTVYSIFLIADPTLKNPTAAVISTHINTPILPYGYSAFSLIGFIATDSSSHFIPGFWTAGNSNERIFTYSTLQTVTVGGGGNALTYSAGATSLVSVVPGIDNTPFVLAVEFIPSAASQYVQLQSGDGAGEQARVTGQVGTVHVTQQVQLLSQLVGGVPKFNYQVSAAGASFVAAVGSYTFYSGSTIF